MQKKLLLICATDTLIFKKSFGNFEENHVLIQHVTKDEPRLTEWAKDMHWLEHITFIKKKKKKSWGLEMAQQLGALAAFQRPRAPFSAPVPWLTTVFYYRPMGTDALFWCADVHADETPKYVNKSTHF